MKETHMGTNQKPAQSNKNQTSASQVKKPQMAQSSPAAKGKAPHKK